MGLFGGGNSSSSSNTTNNETLNDNRIVQAEGAAYVGAGSSLSTSSTSVWDNSIKVSDSSQRTTVDNSVNTVNDPQIAAIARTNAELLHAISDGQGDAVKTIAGFGKNSLSELTSAARDLFTTSASNSAQAWGHTMDVSAEALGKAYDSVGKTLQASASLAGQAMSSYQPPDSKAQDNQLKIAALGALAVIVAAFIARRK